MQEESEKGRRRFTLNPTFSVTPTKEELELIEFLISSIGEPKRVISALKLGYKRKLWDQVASKKGRRNLVESFVKQATKHNLERWDLTEKALKKGVIFGHPVSRTTIWRIKKAIERKFRPQQ
ncbi:hypothetical protein J7L06_05400 [Candidatus Bathyarchaeota archaeon]|nr:hypothetical protein [Candidatus Bathyarchaeota archaeon]